MALAVEVFTMLRKGNLGNMVVLSMGGLIKCKNISREIEVDSMDGLTVSVVEPYWFC